MKKKILTSMLASVLFSLIISTALVILVANYEYVENVKQNLKVNNELIVNIFKSNEIKNK
jgi:two-component system phosphate regulon sensor histidine kinase PhoR